MALNSYKRLQNFFKYSKFFIIGLIVILGSIAVINGIYIILQFNKISNFGVQMDSAIFKLHQTLANPSTSYLKALHNQDSQNLVLLRNGIYPLYKDLFVFINDKINSNSTSAKILSNQNATLLTEAELRDAVPASLKKTLYGLDSNQETEKRNILKEILNTYSKDHAESLTNNLIYSFMATPKCEMYIMEPYSPKQVDLSKGIYPDHPWCNEFAQNPVGTAYITEPYYANTAQHKVSTVMIPVTNESQSIVYYLAGTLNIHDYIDKILYESKDLDPSTTKVMLLVKHGDSNPILYEPWFENQSNIHQNTSFSKSNDNVIINNIKEFYTHNSSNWRSFKLADSNYIITAATKNNDNSFLYPADVNRNRGVSWEWVILRNLPDFNYIPSTSTINPNSNLLIENIYIPSLMFLPLGIGIFLCVLFIRKYFTKTGNILIDLKQVGNATNHSDDTTNLNNEDKPGSPGTTNLNNEDRPGSPGTTKSRKKNSQG